MKDVLGELLRKITNLPLAMLPVLYDLAEKLSGESGQEWFKELKKLLRKENCWTGVDTYFLPIFDGESFVIDATDGTELLADAKDVFYHIGPDFKEKGAKAPGLPTAKTAVKVNELVEDGTFSEIFGSSRRRRQLCFTQAQIKNFAEKYYGWLLRDGRGALFLFESHGNFFVAEMYVNAANALSVTGWNFEASYVWLAKNRYLVVVPQLA